MKPGVTDESICKYRMSQMIFYVNVSVEVNYLVISKLCIHYQNMLNIIFLSFNSN